MDKREARRGIFWILDNGAKWKDLPKHFGAKSSVHKYFTFEGMPSNRRFWAWAAQRERVRREARRLSQRQPWEGRRPAGHPGIGAPLWRAVPPRAEEEEDAPLGERGHPRGERGHPAGARRLSVGENLAGASGLLGWGSVVVRGLAAAPVWQDLDNDEGDEDIGMADDECPDGGAGEGVAEGLAFGGAPDEVDEDAEHAAAPA
ncbi:MAG: transposase [Tepidisphaera sp.]|nr:transposase [Tepidisphaera sp.]